MNKIREIWTKNKILVMLLFILFICFTAIVTVCITFFFGGSDSPYGNRLEDKEKYPITENFKQEYETSLQNDEAITQASLRESGRILYIEINFQSDTTLNVAESKATASLEQISPDILEYYDINFILITPASENSEGYTIMGARNSHGSGIVWNNNTKVESE